MRCAVCQIDGGLVVNVIVASPQDIAPNGCNLVALESDVICGAGWRFNGISFEPPHEEENLDSEESPMELGDGA